MTVSLTISLRFDVVQIGFPKNVGEEKLWGKFITEKTKGI